MLCWYRVKVICCFADGTWKELNYKLDSYSAYQAKLYAIDKSRKDLPDVWQRFAIIV